MVELDNIVALRKRLFDSLGDKETEYKELMRMWFGLKLSRDDLNRFLAKFLTSHQLLLHNQHLLAMLNCGLTTESDSWKKNPAYREADFEPIDPIHCSVIERHPTLVDQPPLMAHEGALLNTKMMFERIQYGAWELELDAGSSAVAEYLCIATRQFLKDILTAIVCRRKSFKTKNKFLCGLGSGQLNPWLRSVPRGRSELFQPLRVDLERDGYLAPNPRPTREVLEQNAAFELAASESTVETLAPISLSDLAVTLKIHPSLVASNFVRVVNWERLYAKINHPTWES